VKSVVFLEKSKRRKGRKNNKINIILFILLLLVVISIAFFVYIKNQGIELKDFSINEFVTSIFSPKEAKNAEVLSEFKNYTQSNSAFGVCGEQLIMCTKDGFKALRENGEIDWAKSFSMFNPTLKTSGSYVLAFDTGGRDIYVISGKSIKWTIRVDNIILNADINDAGYVSVVKEMNGYKGAIEVYDPQGVKIFTAMRSERYIISAKVLPNCSNVLINTVDTLGVSASTKLEFTDIRGTEKASIVKEDAIYPSTWCLDSNVVVAIGNTKMFCTDTNGKQIWEQKYDKILTSNTSSGKFTVVAFKKDGSGSTYNPRTTNIEILNSRGKSVGAFELNYDVVNISSMSGTIAVTTARDVYFINTGGRLFAKYNSKSGIRDVLFIDQHKVAIITSVGVAIIKI